MGMGRTCYAHTHREDVPLEVHHVWPTGRGGPDTFPNRISLCANAHGSAHHYLDRLLKAAPYPPDSISRLIDGDYPPDIPWAIRRRYGKKIRRVAEAGYMAIYTRQVVTL